MVIPANDIACLRDMLDYSCEAVGFLEGSSFEAFVQDRRTLFAVIRCIEVVGEAAGRVSPESKRALPSIPWRNAVSMRNRLIHGYSDVDERLVYNTVTDNLPKLIAQLERVLTPPESS